MVFRSYGLRKTWSDIFLKSLVSEQPLTGNMVNGPKVCCNLKSTITIFSDHFEGN